MKKGAGEFKMVAGAGFTRLLAIEPAQEQALSRSASAGIQLDLERRENERRPLIMHKFA